MMNHDDRWPVRCCFVTALTLAVVFPGFASPVPAEEYHFRFNPPDGLRYEARDVVKKKLPYKSKTQRRWEVVVARSDDRVILKSRPLYDRKFFPSSVTEEAWEGVAEKKYVNAEFDTCGNVLQVYGYGEVLAQIRELSQAKGWNLLEDHRKERVFLREQKEKWNRIIPKLACRTLETGAYVFRVDSIDLHAVDLIRPDSVVCTYALFTAIRIGKPAKCGFGDCVRIKYVQSTDPDDLRKFGGEAFAAYYEAEGHPAADLPHCPVDMLAEGEWVISPSTMLMISDKSKFERRAPLGASRTGELIFGVTKNSTEEYHTFAK